MDRYYYVKGKRIDLKKLHRTSVEWYENEKIAIMIVNYRKIATFKSIDIAYNIAKDIEDMAKEYQKENEITNSSIEK